LAEKKWLRINQNILVTRAGGEDDWYASSVQDINDREFCISMPAKESIPLILMSGEAVKISFIYDNSRFEFETRVKGRRHDNVPLYVLTLPKEYKKVQLRKFARVPVIMEVCYARIPEEGKQPVFNRGDCLDLSGGGIRLLIKEDYPVDTRLIIKFTLPFKTGPEEIEAVGRVVRTWSHEQVRLQHVAVEFVKIYRRQQDLIVRYILSKMSEQRRLS